MKFKHILLGISAFVLIVVFYFILSIRSALHYSQKDFDLDSFQVALINAYATNDSVYFVNGKQEVEGFVVKAIRREGKKESGIFLAAPAYNSVQIEINYFPHDTWMGEIFTDTGRRIDYPSLLAISNSPQSRQRAYSIQFKNFSSRYDTVLGTFHRDTLFINGRLLTDYYEPENNYPERVKEKDDVASVYWTVKDGLIAYKTKCGDYWIKR